MFEKVIDFKTNKDMLECTSIIMYFLRDFNTSPNL